MKFSTLAPLLLSLPTLQLVSALPTNGDGTPCPYLAARGEAAKLDHSAKRDLSLEDLKRHYGLDIRAGDPTSPPPPKGEKLPPVDPHTASNGAGLGDLLGSLIPKRFRRAPVVKVEEEKRDLIGGLFAPLSGILQAIDIPTPQPQGLAKIPATGDNAHRFIKPGPTDIRGDCPTLNTLANHGYLSRNGITTFAEAANACQTVFGFALDISAFLSLLGLFAGGDLITGKYSIGGYDPRVPNTLALTGGKLGGIDSHGRFEVDGSISRWDTFFGDNHSFNQSRWNALVATANQTNNGHFNNLAGYADRQRKYAESKAVNPQFTASPVYLAVSAATRAFLYRALANGTTPNDANYANVAPWYLQEKIPDNWYRRPSPYGLVNFAEDVVDYVLNSPIELGQNQGLGNFVPLDASVPEAPGELLCFVLTAGFLSLAPAQLSNTAGQALDGLLKGILQPILNGAGYGFCNVSSYTTDQGSGGGIYSQSLSSSARATATRLA